MEKPSQFQFFTWYFNVGFHHHRVMVLAKTKEKAIAKALRCVQEKKFHILEGAWTEGIENVIQTGISTGYQKPFISFEEFLRTTEPKVTDSDCLVSISALDG